MYSSRIRRIAYSTFKRVVEDCIVRVVKHARKGVVMRLISRLLVTDEYMVPDRSKVFADAPLEAHLLNSAAASTGSLLQPSDGCVLARGRAGTAGGSAAPA
jgi:hypothetical protein